MLNLIRETPKTPWFPRLTVKHTQPRAQHCTYQPGALNHNDKTAPNGMLFVWTKQHQMAASTTGGFRESASTSLDLRLAGANGTNTCWVSLIVYFTYSI